MTLWKLALSERASPSEIGWAVAIGAFAGCTPAVGFHGPLSLFLATAFRKNRLFAYLGSRISNMVFLPFIALAEVQVAHVLRTGQWLSIGPSQLVAQVTGLFGHWWDQLVHVVRTGTWLPAPPNDVGGQVGSLLLDWCLGTIPVGGAIGFVMGVISWALARARDRRRAAAVVRTEAEPG